MENPFEILGISETIAKELPDEELSAMVRNNYRFLSLKYHPDRMPHEQKKEAEEKFKEISEAFNLLNYPANRESFAYYKNQYVKKKPFAKRIGDLEEKLEQKDMGFSTIIKNFVECISELVDKENTIFADSLELRLFNEIQYKRLLNSVEPKPPKYELSRQVDTLIKKLDDIDDEKKELKVDIRRKKLKISKERGGFREHLADYRRIVGERRLLDKRIIGFYEERKKFGDIDNSKLPESKRLASKYSIVLEKRIYNVEKEQQRLEKKGEKLSENEKEDFKKLEGRLNSLYEERNLISDLSRIDESRIASMRKSVDSYLESFGKKIENNESWLKSKKATEETYRRSVDEHNKCISNLMIEIRDSKNTIKGLYNERAALNKEATEIKWGISKKKSKERENIRLDSYEKSFIDMRIKDGRVYEKKGQRYDYAGERAVGVIPREDFGRLRALSFRNINYPMIKGPKVKDFAYMPVPENFFKNEILKNLSFYPKKDSYLVVAKGKKRGLDMEFYVKGRIEKVKD